MESIVTEISDLDEDTKANFLRLLTERYAQINDIEALVNAAMLLDDMLLIKLVESIFSRRTRVSHQFKTRFCHWFQLSNH